MKTWGEYNTYLEPKPEVLTPRLEPFCVGEPDGKAGVGCIPPPLSAGGVCVEPRMRSCASGQRWERRSEEYCGRGDTTVVLPTHSTKHETKQQTGMCPFLKVWLYFGLGDKLRY